MPRQRITRTVKLGTASDKSFELTALGRAERDSNSKAKDDSRMIKRVSEAREKRKQAFMSSSAKQAAEDALDYLLHQQSVQYKTKALC